MLFYLGADQILNTNTDYRYVYDPAAETLVIEGKLYYLLTTNVTEEVWQAILLQCVNYRKTE